MSRKNLATKPLADAENLFALARAKVSSSGNNRIGLANYKASASLAELRLTVPQFAAHRAYKPLISPCAVPTSYGQLGRLGLPSYVSLENEVVWAARTLVGFAPILNNFLHLREQAEEHHLRGEKDALEGVLTDIVKSCGVSLWLAELRISAWREFSGSKHADVLARDLARTPGMGPLARYIINWLDFRSSQDLSSSEFSRLLRRAAPLRKGGLAPLLHVLLGECPVLTEEEAANALSYGDQVSAVDRYLILRSTIQVLVAGRTLSAAAKEVILTELRILERLVTDPTLSRLLAVLGGHPSRPPSSVVPLAILNLYTEGAYAEARQACDTQLLARIALDLLLIRERCAQYDHASFLTDESPNESNPVYEAGPIARIERDIARIVGFAPDGAEAITRLAKAASENAASPWAAGLTLFLSRTRADDRVAPPTQRQIHLALRQDIENPALAFCFEPIGAASSYLAWAYPDAGHEKAGQVVLALLHPEQELPLPSELIDRHRRARLDAIRALRRGEPSKAISLLRTGYSAIEAQVPRIETGLLLAQAYLKAAELHECAEICADLYLSSEYTGRLLPIKELVDALIERSEALLEPDPDLLGRLPVVIVLDLFSRLISPIHEAERADAFKDFLRVQGVRHASDLVSRSADFKRSQLLYFLRHVCVPNVLDQSLALGSTRAVEDERAKVLLLLSDLTSEEGKPPSPEIMDELREIRTKQVVRETTRQLDQSRIYVNVEGVKRALAVSMREDWQHYRLAMLQGDLGKQIELQKLVQKLEKEGYQVISVGGPLTARDQLLVKMVYEVRDLFASSKEFGLDANLSTNVRHGYVMRELRGPFVAANLVTNKSTEQEGYRSNRHWLSRHETDGGWDASRLDEALKKFTAEIDRTIEHLNRSVLRIRSETTPDGLFQFTFQEALIRVIRERCAAMEGYEEFIDLVLETLWEMTDHSLDQVQAYLRTPVRQDFNRALAQLQADLDELTPTETVGALKNAATLVRPEINSAVERVASWFVLSADSDFADYRLRIAYEAGLATVRSYFGDLDMSPNFIESGDIILAGPTLPTFVRIFAILIENAALHSGISRGQLRLRGEALLANQTLTISVMNALHPTFDREQLRKTLDRINSRFNREGAEGAIVKEGASGFPKIWRLLTHDLRGQHEFRATLTKDDEFEVRIKLDARGIAR
jgi:hypothetical protein